MKTGLNLGCGRATFPTTPDNPYTQHLLYAIHNGCPEAMDSSVQWTNVDRVNGPNINAVINLWRLPWLKSDNRPFADNSFDFVWMSHLIEHIPHDMRINPNAHMLDGYLTKLSQQDGDMWWGWFYEIWRILKPGGQAHIITPYALSLGALGDPTHTRYITPSTFGYFSPNDDAPFDYDLPYRFKQVPSTRGSEAVNALYRMTGKSMKLREQIAALRKLKDALETGSAERGAIDARIAAVNEEAEEYAAEHVQQVEEMYFVFEAVKP